MGATALRQGNFPRAIKLLNKSLQLYPLPGVEALLDSAKRQDEQQKHPGSAGTNSSNGGGSSASANHPEPPRRAASTASSTTGADGRAYTEDHVAVVQKVLKAKEGGRGAHYRVLGLQRSCTEAEIKKAYRKLSLKVHPDKNSAPHADEAFKAVGLAYATLSDPQKRRVYDTYGDEDPDNGGGAGGPFGGMRRRGGRGGGVHMNGQQVDPEEIFNMFFGGGMPMGGGGMPGGVHFYSTGFGPGMHFRAGGPRARPRGGGGDAQGPQNQQSGWNAIMQFLPIILMLLLSFARLGPDSSAPMPGENKYFSLTVRTIVLRMKKTHPVQRIMRLACSPCLKTTWTCFLICTPYFPLPQPNPPFTNPLSTKLSKVKEIPYFVSDRFLRTFNRDRYQLGQVERMVERAYEKYLVDECNKQTDYKSSLMRKAIKESSAEKQEVMHKRALEFELTRCTELQDLFPNHRKEKRAF
jgi:hypothetical protein